MTDTRTYTGQLIASGVLLLAAFAFLSRLSHEFAYGGSNLERPIPVLVLVLSAAGAVYLWATIVTVRSRAGAGLLVWILGVGVALRALMFMSTPILEDDFYRYLWDGGVVASGHNPYRYTPHDARFPEPGSAVPAEIQELAVDAGVVAMRVNHPHLGTVYPPTAQGAFAVAHLVGPWSLHAWRAVLSCFEFATLALLLALLRRMERPLHYAAIYWWNPVVINEVVNSAHMDAVALAFVLAALLLTLSQKPVRAGLFLALGIGAKLWPLVLAPLLVRTLRVPRARLAGAAAIASVFLLLLLTPMFWAFGLGPDSGLLEYGERWEMNDALFMALQAGVRGLTPLDGRALNIASRAVAGALLLAWIAYLARNGVRDASDLSNRCVLVLGAMFMLSPTQFPWYYVWMVPFLSLSPRYSLLVLTVTLPMYYIRFYFAARGDAPFFHNRLVWVEYAPVFVLAAWEWYRATHARPPRGEAVAEVS